MKGRIAIVLWVPVALFAQEVRNPSTSPEDVAAGGRVYRSHCAECHGLKGDGGRGPNLTGGEFRHGSSDEALLKIIDNGIPGTEMPGVYFEKHQLWQIVSFVRSLSAGASPRELPGDPRRGRELFHGSAGCAVCHMVNGAGGRQGPELSDVGGRRAVVHLRASLLEPNAEVRHAWWGHRVRTSDGKSISGFRLNEDTYSIQLRDSAGNLISLRKAALAEIQVSRTSTMPPFGGANAETDDLIAYLVSLRRK